MLGYETHWKIYEHQIQTACGLMTAQELALAPELVPVPGPVPVPVSMTFGTFLCQPLELELELEQGLEQVLALVWRTSGTCPCAPLELELELEQVLPSRARLRLSSWVSPRRCGTHTHATLMPVTSRL